jgi:Domain of unknown function (DUF4169)
MSADILSLSKARKAKARAVKDAQAGQNRILHGRTKAEKAKDEAERVKAARRIEAHRIEPAPVAALSPCKPDA